MADRRSAGIIILLQTIYFNELLDWLGDAPSWLGTGLLRGDTDLFLYLHRDKYSYFM